MTTADLVLGAGAAIAVIGGLMLVVCMIRAYLLKQAGEDGPEAEQALQRLLGLNMGGVVLGFLGVGLVMVGLILG